MTDADPTTRARRIISLADAALEQVDATRRAVEELLAEVRDAPTSVVPLDGAGLDGARLAAIEMAVAGRSRAEVERHVRAAYGLVDVDALLDDVFGPGETEARSAS